MVLLLAVVDEQSPRHLRFRREACTFLACAGAREVQELPGARDQLEGAAQVLLRAARIVTVDGRKNDDIMAEFGISRDLTAVRAKTTYDFLALRTCLPQAFRR